MMPRVQETCRCRNNDIEFEVANKMFFVRSDGALVRKISTSNRSIAGQVVGNKTFQVKIFGRSYLVHRIVWLLTYGEWPSKDIDHINGNRKDNRPENLRLCTNAENAQNRIIHKNNKSGFLGVYYHKNGLWRSSIMVGGKNISLGLYRTPEDAHAAYLKAKTKHHKFNPVPRDIT